MKPERRYQGVAKRREKRGAAASEQKRVAGRRVGGDH